MPLRVAEKDGYVYGVNGCGECPFGDFGMLKIERPRFYCEHEQGKIEEKISGNSIPVWCPLPTGEYKLFKVLEPENKLDIHTDHIRKKLPNS